MPIYDFLCPSCETGHLDRYVPGIGETIPCVDCGTKTEIVWSITPRDGMSVYPYVTRNITKDGSPVEVKSALHLKELCRKHGVTPRDDSAWITKEWHGYDWKTKRQVYTESTGVGDPGCWI